MKNIFLFRETGVEAGLVSPPPDYMRAICALSFSVIKCAALNIISPAAAFSYCAIILPPLNAL